MWELPGGAAEPGTTFRETAAQELFEEAGLRVEPADLVPFGPLSEPEVHLISYPNGDQIHAFSLCFEARRWTGDLKLGLDEVVEAAFYEEAPEPMQPQTRVVWEMYRAFRATGGFQGR